MGSRSAHCGVSGEAGLQAQRLAAEVVATVPRGASLGGKPSLSEGVTQRNPALASHQSDEGKLGVCWRDKGLREILESVLSQEEERPAGAQECWQRVLAEPGAGWGRPEGCLERAGDAPLKYCLRAGFMDTSK